jgi:hypothetical protein
MLLVTTVTHAQTLNVSDEMLNNNERVMNVLMQKIQRHSKLQERQNLILEHMKLMGVYVTNLENRISVEKDADQKSMLQLKYRNALHQSLILVESGIRDKEIITMGITAEDHMHYIEKRMLILQNLMFQVAKADTILDN